MFQPILLPLLYTVCLEAPLVALLYPGRRGRMALVCLVATSATFLNMTLLLPRLSDSYAVVLVTGELMAVVLEAAALALADHERDWSRALMASALANALSFGASQVLGG